MADYNLGPYRLKPRGEYDDTVAYSFLDLVRYQGSGYVCCAEDLVDGASCTGIAPAGDTNSELYWMLLVEKGDAPSSSEYQYMAFTTITNGIWDYDVTDKIVIPSDGSGSISINNAYDGCCGLLVTSKSSLSLPSNSSKSIDFNYVTLQTGQIYLYSFVYCDYGNGGRFLWNRTVINE